MTSQGILILTDEFDTHADMVEQKISSLGGYPIRMNLNVEALRRTAITSVDGDWRVQTGTSAFRATDVAAVWPRRLTVSMTLEQQFEHQSNAMRLWRGEWNRGLYGLYVALRDRYWMNPIQSASLADNKVYQSKIAKSVGLCVPEWIISNSKNELLEFSTKFGEVALKFMSQDMYENDTDGFLGLYVNKITSREIEEFGDFSENPVTLQRYVRKSFEVRYTVVEDTHFVCAIHSQLSPKASTDWRRYDLPNTPHLPINPPPIIKSKITDFMSQLSLKYGAVDFVVDENGKWWFLEVNTAGQWLWIEDLTGLAISDEIARRLVTRSRGECE